MLGCNSWKKRQQHIFLYDRHDESLKPQKKTTFRGCKRHGSRNCDYNLNPSMTAQIEIEFCGVADFGVHNRA